MLRHITEKEFNQVEESKEVILVDFYATWCPPCQKLTPVLEELANSRKYNIVSVNVDDNLALGAKYNVQVVPTLVVFKAGKVVETKQGYMSKEAVMQMLDSHMEE